MPADREPLAAIALDIGRRRIGVAGCDGLGLLATGLATVARSPFEAAVAELRAIAQERGATVLVVGLPYRMDGSTGTQARRIKKDARRLAAALALPLEFCDERLSSVEAEERLRSRGWDPLRDKGAVDREAAALILQRWLDERRVSCGDASRSAGSGGPSA